MTASNLSSLSSCNQWTHEWAQKNNLESFFLHSIDSTHSWAKRDFQNHETLSVFLADHQTHGRGRYERTWTNSDPGSTLLSTWCLKTSQTPQPILSCRLGLKIYQTLTTVFPQLPFSLKAPNDIFLDSGKLLGILIEIENTGHESLCFFGIGMNVFDKPKAVGVPTACLKDHTLVTRELWSHFCFLMQKNFLELQKDLSRSLLLESEKEELLKALNQHPLEKYSSVDSHGQLMTLNGDLRSWMDI